MTERPALTRTEHYPGDVTAARAARTLVSDFLAAVGWDGADVERARLAASELVANAVVHARSAPTLTVTYQDGALRLAVRDDDPTSDPRPRDEAAPGGGGLGLRFVASLSRDWGVERTDAGKTVWCTMEPHRSSATAGAGA
jgi:anti-sigma regulatory factor (Ser/Thr protein kinase)